jgi:hypothetical protein
MPIRRNAMTVDLEKARDFMATHARLLDRRRFELRHSDVDTAGVLAALGAYRNPDGGYGWGLEPDLRSPESQPAAAGHAFEVFDEIAPRTSPDAAALCDWLGAVSHPDGGLPFARPLTFSAGSGPWWAAGDGGDSSLQITSFTAAAALRAARHDAAVASHPWLERAVGYCLAEIEAIDRRPFAYVLAFAVRFLDAATAVHPRAAELISQLGAYVPDDGRLPVQGGAEGEALHPLDLAPFPNRPARALFSAEVIEADLDRLVAGQRPDGGWTVDYLKISPAGALEWRGYATVLALDILRGNGRI